MGSHDFQLRADTTRALRFSSRSGPEPGWTCRPLLTSYTWVCVWKNVISTVMTERVCVCAKTDRGRSEKQMLWPCAHIMRRCAHSQHKCECVCPCVSWLVRDSFHHPSIQDHCRGCRQQAIPQKKCTHSEVVLPPAGRQSQCRHVTVCHTLGIKNWQLVCQSEHSWMSRAQYSSSSSHSLFVTGQHSWG